jgi:putative DNA primase/helicase
MSSAKAAARYIERGWAPVPIPARQKGPRISDWQRLRLSLEDVPRYFNNGQNVGIINGKASGGLVTVDLDRPEAVALAGRFLQPTLVSGRESVPDGHWWYISPSLEHREFEGIPNSVSEGTILELRSTDHQTVVEPSIHPSGERYRWNRSGLEPLETGAEELTNVGQHLATAALIACHLPESKERGGGGGRYHYALALAGYLLRHGISAEEVETLLRAAWDAKGWRGIERHRKSSYAGIERAVRDTAQKLGRGDPTTGGRTLEGMVQGLPRKIADFLGWERFTLREGRGAYLCNDTGNAERLADRHGANLRYCYPWGRWLVYDGTRWRVDDRGAVARLAKDTARSVFEEAKEAGSDTSAKELGKWASVSLSESKLRAMISLAQSEPGIPVLPEEMDASPDLLNVLNGTIDLRTGELREHRREDLITKIAPVEYDPGAVAPVWAATLERTLPSEDVRQFFKKLCGYALSGDVSEHVLPVLYGTGANGKSTVLNGLLEAAGEYGMQAAPDLLIAKRGGHPTEIADLFGMRVVASIEVEDGRRLAEALVKNLTGGDKIRARRMRQDNWQFDPTHTVFMAVNHKPIIKGTDTGIWRRIRLIPFTEAIPPAEQDKQLPQKLRAELPGILAWAVEGCLEWRRGGLQAPEEVRKATAGYRSEMDVIGDFLADRCYRGERLEVAKDELYKAYHVWCEDAGERPETKRKFGMILKDRGIEDGRNAERTQRMWRGIGLSQLKRRTQDAEDAEDVSGVENGIDKRRTTDGATSTGHKAGKSTISSSKIEPRGVNGKIVSEVSEVSENLTVEAARALMRRKDTGPGRAYSTYLELPTSGQRLEYLVKAILRAKKLDTSEWELYRPVVLEASAREDA